MKNLISTFDFDAASNPSYLTHKVYAGVGYIFEKWKNHILLGLGSSYEFASDNNELENWSLWCKAGLNF